MSTADLSKGYREALWVLWSKGEFKNDPERNRRIQSLLSAWDKWAHYSNRELEKLNQMSRVWCLVLIVPALVYAYEVYQISRLKREWAKKLDEAWMLVDQWGRPRGQTMIEMEAISAVKTDLLR